MGTSKVHRIIILHKIKTENKLNVKFNFALPLLSFLFNNYEYFILASICIITEVIDKSLIELASS